MKTTGAAILITGASRGIGRALAQAAATTTSNLDVILVSRCATTLKETTERIQSEATNDDLSARLHTVAADVSTPAGRQSIVSAVHNINSRLAYVVHNAGTLGPLGNFRDVASSSTTNTTTNTNTNTTTNTHSNTNDDGLHLDLDTWRSTFATNVEAPLFLTRDLLPSLLASSDLRGSPSRVLTLSSGAAFDSFTGIGTYCATKAALHSVTRSLQNELDPSRVAVTSVVPGLVETDMLRLLRMAKDSAISNSYQRSVDENIKDDNCCCEGEGGREEKKEKVKGKKEEMQIRTSEEIAKYLCWLLFECDANVFHERSYWDVDKEEDVGSIGDR